MDDLLVSFVLAVMVSGSAFLGSVVGKDVGRIQVASGQYSCALIPNEDKTAKWECKPTKEER